MTLQEQKAALEAKLAEANRRIEAAPSGHIRVALKRQRNILTGQIHDLKCAIYAEQERAALEGLNAEQ
jgi:hypothetical protein